jgi:hypothetical protein
MTDLFQNHLWPGLLVWTLLYVSDYSLTIACARLYRAQSKIVFEGSFELTPEFQKDVDALRRWSPRFLVALGTSLLLLFILWTITRVPPGMPEAYAFALGAMILLELVVHLRHLRNWFFFRALPGDDGPRGSLEYPRPMVLRLSGMDILCSAGLLAILFAFQPSAFLLGGVASCLATGMKHLRMARKQGAVPRVSQP